MPQRLIIGMGQPGEPDLPADDRTPLSSARMWAFPSTPSLWIVCRIV
jgi:hypothetical protein